MVKGLDYPWLDWDTASSKAVSHHVLYHGPKGIHGELIRDLFIKSVSWHSVR